MISFYDLLGRKTSVTSATPLPVTSSGGGAAGAPVSGNPTLVAGSDGTNTRIVKTDASGNVAVYAASTLSTGGNVGSAVADSGNPVKVGAKYNLTPVVFATGQRTDLQSDANGYLKVVTSGAGTDAAGNELVVGNVAAGVADTGNPVKTGGVASLGTPTAVATGQRANSWLTANGATVISFGPQTATAAAFTSNTVLSSIDQSGVARTFTTAPTMYDGTNLVLVRGDAVGGLYTQEKERAVFYGEGTAAQAVAASANATGGARNSGTVAGICQWAVFQGFVRPSEASAGGQIVLQGSDDGSTNWVNLANAAAAGTTAITLSTPVFFNFHRVVFINGTTAQTALYMRSRYAAQ